MAKWYLMSFSRPSDGRRSVALIVFIGGVTSGELSALRFLSSQVCWDMWYIIFNDLVDHLPCFLYERINHVLFGKKLNADLITVFLIAGRNGLRLHYCDHQSCEWQYIAWDTFGHHCQKLMRNCSPRFAVELSSLFLLNVDLSIPNTNSGILYCF